MCTCSLSSARTVCCIMDELFPVPVSQLYVGRAVDPLSQLVIAWR
jgi:hypothetical protein